MHKSLRPKLKGVVGGDPLHSYNSKEVKKRYLSKVRCRVKRYAALLTYNEYKILRDWPNEGELSNINLGKYRHLGIYCNYDDIVDQIQFNEAENLILCRDIIHGLSNVCTSHIIKIIIQYERDEKRSKSRPNLKS